MKSIVYIASITTNFIIIVPFFHALSASNKNEAENTNLNYTYLCIFSITSGSVKQYLSSYEQLKPVLYNTCSSFQWDLSVISVHVIHNAIPMEDRK